MNYVYIYNIHILFVLQNFKLMKTVNIAYYEYDK